MPTRIRLFALLLCITLPPLAGCDSPSAPAAFDAVPDILASRNPAAARPHTASIPFRARAYTVLESLVPDPACGEPPRFLNTQVGEGTATHLGRFSVRFTFCVDFTDLLDDGQLTQGESIPYDGGVGTLVAANGDVLTLTIEGAVLPSGDPDFDFQFQDRFVFIGGTGRFAGASGAGMTDSYVTRATNRTEHRWSGVLVVRPGH